MIYKIIVDKQPRANPSSEKRTYIIDIEELRYLGETKDTLIVGKGEDYVMRRLEISPFFVLKKLETPIKEPIKDLDVELFEGENYIYLEDVSGSLLFAEYIIKNDFTDTYVTDAQMQSAIEISRGLIEISIDTKLNGYSTTTEMNAAIKASQEEINLSVAKNYFTKGETKKAIETAKGEIKTTTDEITAEVSKKVGENEVIGKINLSSESATIDARKSKYKRGYYCYK